MIVEFPAIFSVDEENPNYINVEFPDIIGAITCGTDIYDAYYMAQDLLKTMLNFYKQNPPTPSTLEKIQNNFPDKNVKMIKINL